MGGGGVLTALQPWQSAFGSFIGLIAIFVAAAMGFRFNRRRDKYLRQNELQSVAAALYAEILMLRKYAAGMANHVAARYEDHGLGRRQGEPFDRHFFEMVPMPSAPIYQGLSSEIGRLPAGLLLGIVQFHSYYEDARYWLPRLEEKEERGFSYDVLHVLRPALDAVEGIQPTLEAIEALAGITPAAVMPDLKRSKHVATWEEEQWAEIREQRG